MEETTRPKTELHVRHLTGLNPATGQFAPTVLSQFRQALTQGALTLEQHGRSLRNVTRMVFTLISTNEFASCFATLNEVFGRTCPAITFRLVRKHAHPHQLIELDILVATSDGDSPIA